MPLTAADIKFFAAATATDASDGGGRRSPTLVQNGLDNNLFPDVVADDRLQGLTRLRKAFPSLTNTDAAALLGGALALDSVPADADTRVALWAYGGAGTTRAEFVAAVQAWHDVGADVASFVFTDGGLVSSGTRLYIRAFAPYPTEGQVLGIRLDGEDPADPRSYDRYVIQSALFVNSGSVSAYMSLTLDRPLPTSYSAGSPSVAPLVQYPMRALTEVRPYGIAAVPGSLTSGPSTVTVSSLNVKLVPYVSGAYPTAVRGFPPAALEYADGEVQVIREGDAVTLWHETTTSAATATNGGTVNVGRTNLEQLAVVGANGVEIARFMVNGPNPTPTSGAMTANLAAGTVTFSSVTGFSQPVTVRHRIAHRSAVSSISSLVVTLANVLTRDFPAGSVLSSHLPLGDVQARVSNVFAQQSWTRVFSDSLIGNPVTLPYTGTPATTNQGAETDRWAIVFTTGNTFACYSEALGLVATGNTATNFSPINPVTGAPFFTLLAASWASSLLVGSVLRFNTQAAALPVWVSRCTVPGTGSGNTTAALRVLGSANA